VVPVNLVNLCSSAARDSIPELAMLQDAMMVIMHEPSGKERIQSGVFKEITATTG
jgi:hypothetical protein